MDHSFCAKYGNVLIRPLEEKDIENLRIWRNDPAQTKFLRNVGYITAEMQLNWYNNYLSNQNQVIFAIDEISELNRMVGSLSLYDIDVNKRVVEIGKIQIGDNRAHGKGIGRISFVLAMKIAIDKMNVEKIIAKVCPDNIQAYTNYMRVGFKVVGNHTTDMGIVEEDIEIAENDLRRSNYYYDQITIKEI